MGAKLMEIYKKIGDVAGMTGKVKLAQMTKVPSTKAALAPDSPEKIAAFEKAFKEITGRPL